jgi:hypothetical protein
MNTNNPKAPSSFLRRTQKKTSIHPVDYYTVYTDNSASLND